MTGPGENLNADLIELDLGTTRIGRRVLVYESTSSTNDVALNYATEKGYDGLAVFAEQQHAGRGRLGRRWSAPHGSSVLCSILLQQEQALTGPALSLLAAVAAAETVESATGKPARIKWPNDVVVDSRKVAGTMVEGRPGRWGTHLVVGIGLNCNQGPDDYPPEVRGKAVSLRELRGGALRPGSPGGVYQEVPGGLGDGVGRGAGVFNSRLQRDLGAVDRVAVARGLLRALDRWVALMHGRGISSLHDAWVSRCDDLGRRLAVVQDGVRYEGRVVDVSPEQGLLLQLDRGGARFFDAATTTVWREGQMGAEGD